MICVLKAWAVITGSFDGPFATGNQIVTEQKAIELIRNLPGLLGIHLNDMDTLLLFPTKELASSAKTYLDTNGLITFSEIIPAEIQGKSILQ